MMRRKGLMMAFLGVLAGGFVTGATAAVYTEDFESGWAPGAEVGTHPDWYSEPTRGPWVNQGVGVAGSTGLSPGRREFTWTAHPFSWSDPGFTGVVMQMDYQAAAAASPSGPFDDDRLGWVKKATSVNRADNFLVDMDEGIIRAKWDNVNGSERKIPLATLPAVIPDAWYRFRVEFTKLTATSARIDVSLTELDELGTPGNVILTVALPDTNALPVADLPNPALFTTAPLYATYKSYLDKSPGGADNAYLEVIPEPASALILGAGAVLLISCRKRRPAVR